MAHFRQILLLSATLLVAIPLFAQNDTPLTVRQFVRNSFTKNGIDNALITLMREDSTVIDTVRTVFDFGRRNARVWSYDMERRTQNVIVRVEHPEYETYEGTYRVVNYGRNEAYELPELFIRRKAKDMYKDLEQMMDEVTVVATKVKVVYKKDTIIYNADAFNVPDGSMLDGLIRQLPGAELRKNGEIYINGKKIDYLTFNGKDLMKGDSKVMLDNLPYYTVEKLKVFHKSTERSRLLGRDVEEKDYVMDVQLKREYSVGQSGHISVGGGTHDRWKGRLVNMRFTDSSRLIIVGSANNVNEDGGVLGVDGTWYGNEDNNGDKTAKRLYVMLTVDEKHGRYKEDVTASGAWSKHMTESRTARQTFMETGDIYSRMRSAEANKQMQLSLRNNLTLYKLGTTWNTSVVYATSDGKGNSREASFDADPNEFGTTMAVLDSVFAPTLRPELLSISTNRISNSSLSESDRLRVNSTITWDKAFRWGDDIRVKFNAVYNDNDANTFGRYSLDYPKGNGTGDLQNQYSSDTQNDYSYSATVDYNFHFLSDWHVAFQYEYSQKRTSRDFNRHRLDWLGGDWGLGAEDGNFGMLPSAHEDMIACLDAQNSYASGHQWRRHGGKVKAYYSKQDGKAGEKSYFEVDVPARYVAERNHYVRNTLNTVVRNSSWLFMPQVRWERQSDEWRSRWDLNYKCDMTTPDIMQLVDIRDTSDPLAVRLGNPDLKGATTHSFGGSAYRRFRKNNHTLSFNIGANIMTNLVANGFTYDRTTGVYTYRPENVNGNWSGNASLKYRGYFDKQHHWTFETSTSYHYYRNVDLVSESGSERSRSSKVDNNVLSEVLNVEYSVDKLRLVANGSANWNRSRGVGRLSTTGLNAVDYSYGMFGQYEFPLKLQFFTSFTVNGRRGYDEPSMNTDDLVWFASIGRSFLNNQLNLRVEAHDILRQLSQTTYVVNGQGRIETWRRTLPSYVMASLTWRLHSNPKKKK